MQSVYHELLLVIAVTIAVLCMPPRLLYRNRHNDGIFGALSGL